MELFNKDMEISFCDHDLVNDLLILTTKVKQQEKKIDFIKI